MAKKNAEEGERQATLSECNAMLQASMLASLKPAETPVIVLADAPTDAPAVQ